MTKSELLGIYRTKLNHIKLTYATLLIWSYPDTPGFFDALHSEMKNIEKPFTGLSEFLHDDKAMRIACEELYDSSYRSALNELLPLTKSYCHENSILTKLKEQSWFQFWRIIRNCWAHDMIFNFNKNERLLLPVTWSGITIDITMNGEHLTHGQCSRENILALISAAQQFIENEPA